MRTIFVCTLLAQAVLSGAGLPDGKPGTTLRYSAIAPSTRVSSIGSFELTFGPDGWVSLRAAKRDGSRYQLWILHPAAPVRYIVQEAGGVPREYRHAQTGAAVPPSAVPLSRLLPQAIPGSAIEADYLGHRYRQDKVEASAMWALPPDVQLVPLRPDMLVGPASNARQKDETRRWDLSDYTMVRFTRDDYRQLAEAGITCVRVDDEQLEWADALGLYYWGAGQKLRYPEMLYRSQYLGPSLFLDEPAVGTRDHVLRPRLAKDEAFRRSITPQDGFAAFRTHYAEALEKGAPVALARMLAARGDVDLGSMKLRQENLYSWETMVGTAAYELVQEPGVPEAFVFEPPGRVGTRRTLPEMNMTYGTQFATDDPRALTGLLFSFLRGAARLASKNWGVSIYGAVDRTDAFGWLTQAYDVGATRFHFWDNYQLACVPFKEYVALARHLRNHAASSLPRDLARLKRGAEVAITLPPGYDLGHVFMGRGSLWGLTELNLERRNTAGVQYRTVMSNFFLEGERCLRQGIAFDAMWELPGHAPAGYREIVRVREDGKVEVERGGRRETLAAARPVPGKEGSAPSLSVSMKGESPGPVLQVTATARVTETSAPVFYTHGTDSEGIYRNAMVLWELFGPVEEEYRVITPEGMRPTVRWQGDAAEVAVRFPVERAGRYRLRAATVDTAGRRRVVWSPFQVIASSGRLVLE